MICCLTFLRLETLEPLSDCFEDWDNDFRNLGKILMRGIIYKYLLLLAKHIPKPKI